MRIFLFTSMLIFSQAALSYESVIAFSKAQQAFQKKENLKYDDTNGDKAYARLLLGAQYQMLTAGLPHKLKYMEELSRSGALDNIDLLVLPANYTIDGSHARGFYRNLMSAIGRSRNPLNLVVIGEMNNVDERMREVKESSQYNYEILKLEYDKSISEESVDMYATNTDFFYKPIEEGKLLSRKEKIWYTAFRPISKRDGGFDAYPLLKFRSRSGTYVGGWALEGNNRRVVHFSSAETALRTPIFWRSLLWAKYGNHAPGILGISRKNQMFVSRTDFDLAGDVHAQKNMVRGFDSFFNDVKEKYNFVGSHYLAIGDETHRTNCKDAPKGKSPMDWSFSAPYYRRWVSQGHEIGTHSITHPNYTDNCSDAEMDYEFGLSRKIIESQLGISAPGGAIPGNNESLKTASKFGDYLKYISGELQSRTSQAPGGFGKLYPGDKLTYLGPSMTFDFTVIDVQQSNTAQLLNEWKLDYHQMVDGYEKSILHFPFHGYALLSDTLIESWGPLGSNATANDLRGRATLGRYNKRVFYQLFDYMDQSTIEYLTAEDLVDRMDALNSLNYELKDYNGVMSLSVNSVNGQKIGTFSVDVDVKRDEYLEVQGYYAYSKGSVFLSREMPRNIRMAKTFRAPNQTKISDLPMRAELLRVNGDGRNLNFTLKGEGKVVVSLNENYRYQVSCNNGFNQGMLNLNGSELEINLKSIASHDCNIVSVGENK